MQNVTDLVSLAKPGMQTDNTHHLSIYSSEKVSSTLERAVLADLIHLGDA